MLKSLLWNCYARYSCCLSAVWALTLPESSLAAFVFMALILHNVDPSARLLAARGPFPLLMSIGAAVTIYFPEVVSPARSATSGPRQHGQRWLTHGPSREKERERERERERESQRAKPERARESEREWRARERKRQRERAKETEKEPLERERAREKEGERERESGSESEREREQPSFLTWQFHGSHHRGWNQNLLGDVYYGFKCSVLKVRCDTVPQGSWVTLVIDVHGLACGLLAIWSQTLICCVSGVLLVDF